ncbi:MAG: hypothetical protein K6T73_06610 [Candidatus Bathyarchaeota archaeon]|nr:hypothetical protein [Candidatus Bathyarchaeota archaeon]
MVKERPVKIDGSEEFPFDSLGLTKDSIKRKGEFILIPVELMPYLKLCILPVRRRIQVADYMYRYRKKLRNNGRKSAGRGGVK